MFSLNSNVHVLSVFSRHLCIYEITNKISYVGKLNGRNLHKNGQRKQSKDSSQKRARKK